MTDSPTEAFGGASEILRALIDRSNMTEPELQRKLKPGRNSKNSYISDDGFRRLLKGEFVKSRLAELSTIFGQGIDSLELACAADYSSDPDLATMLMNRARAALPLHLPGSPGGPSHASFADWQENGGPPSSFFDFRRIVVGDRRSKTAPQSVADVLARGASAADLRYILGMQLDSDTLVVTDKFVAVSSQVQEQLGHSDIVCLGSPRVSFAARRTNAQTLFPLAIDTRGIRASGNALVRKLLGDKSRTTYVNRDGVLERRHPGMFQRDRLAENLQRKELQSMLEAYYDQWGARGFINPLASWLRSDDEPDLEPAEEVEAGDGDRSGPIRLDWLCYRTQRRESFYGTISLGLNPFSENKDQLAMMVAGRGRAGTAIGLRLLSGRRADETGSTYDYRAELRKRPFGGLFRVRTSAHTDYGNRYPTATVRWLTPPYTIEDFQEQLAAREAELQRLRSTPEVEIARGRIESMRAVLSVLERRAKIGLN